MNPAKAKQVIAAGLPRSGSTLQYNLVRGILKTLHIGHGAGLLKWVHIVPVVTCWTVAKIHHAHPLIVERAGAVAVVQSYRDIRDAFVSHLHFESLPLDTDPATFVQPYLDMYHGWDAMPPHALYRVAYCTMVNDVVGEVGRLAAFLGVELTPLQTQCVIQFYANPKDESFTLHKDHYHLDPVTLRHDNHIYSGRAGQWMDVLSTAQIGIIEDLAGEWLKEHGYEVHVA